MSVVRVEKTTNYTVMSNYHLQEKEMSFKTKGLMSVILSLPPDWDYSIAGLSTLSKDNSTAVKSALKELEEFGYLKITKIFPDQSETGRIQYVYTIYEEPQEDLREKPQNQKQEGKKQGLEILGVEILAVENRNQLNTKEVNTNNKKVNPSSKDDGRNSIIPSSNKKKSRGKDIGTMRKMLDSFTQNESIRKNLTIYFNERVKKGLKIEQWKIILEDLREYAGEDAKLADDKIRGAIAGGYMQIIAPWEKEKKYNSNKPRFDNTAGRKTEAVVNMTEEQKKEFEENLARDEDGNLMEF